MNEILTFIQIAGFVAAGVWIVATIKSKVDTLVQSIGELTTTIDDLRMDMHSLDQKIDGHDKRIAALEANTTQGG